MQILTPLTLGPRTAPNRIMFGPHVTNLGGDDRSLTARHVAYYERRAAGGCGTVVIEGASVHASDWPYERAPLAERCATGWRSVAEACRPHGSLVIASLDHAGGQGSSAYSQAPLWAPSRVPETNTREVPKWMEADDIEAVIDGFRHAAKLASEADLDGVEINAGQHSLVRQFLSGLTNQREDEWGQDRLLFARRVIAATRDGAGVDRIVGLRLSCDELAPWAGITPGMAPDIAGALASAGVDYLVVTRGSIFSAEKTRPDFHEPPGFNIDVCRAVCAAVDIPVILQGSIVDIGQAEWALGGYDDPPLCHGVEMTRAQIADPDVAAKVGRDENDRIRPCTRCNQTCQVRDARNPIVTCIGEPSSGRETEDPDWYQQARTPRTVVVVGGGPAGLETARIAAIRGHDVTIVERDEQLGGVARVAGPNRPLVDWHIGELDRLGVTVRLGVTWREPGPDPLAREDRAPGGRVRDAPGGGEVVVQCTGGVAGPHPYDVEDGALVLDIADIRTGTTAVPAEGTIVVFDPIGGPIGVAIAEELGTRAVLVTQDNIAGNELARTGDLAPANTRLAQAGVTIERRTLLRSVSAGAVEVEDRYSGERRAIECVAVIDCGFRVPTEPFADVATQAGDAVAPRTVHEAVLEGRRAAASI